MLEAQEVHTAGDHAEDLRARGLAVEVFLPCHGSNAPGLRLAAPGNPRSAEVPVAPGAPPRAPLSKVEIAGDGRAY